MTPVEQFPEGGGESVVFGANQPEYEPLPALRFQDGRVRMEFAPSEAERAAIGRGENIRLWQWTRGALQPVLLEVTDEHHD